MKKTDISNINLLTKGAKLNFQIFPILELEDNNLACLNLVNSAVLSGTLRNICFYNASFLSTKFHRVFFERCNLKSSDLCSIWVSDCLFQKTDFNSATISDSTFINCTFDEASFESISMTRCQFINCTFEQLSIDDSTVSLNTFNQCHIKNTHFTESFYYQIFDDCTFYKAETDPILLGFNFGFSSKVISQLVSESNLKRTNSDFIRNKLYLNAAILRINEVQKYYDQALIACVVALGQMMENDILIQAEEIEFLKNLTLHFQENKQIAPISILRIWQLLNNNIMNIPSNIATNKAMPLIREYANMLYLNFMDFQKNLQDRIYQLPKTSNLAETSELQIVYSVKPQLPIMNYLSEFSNLVGPDCPIPKLIRAEKGSFREYHEIAVAILPYLQTFFSFLGIVVPIVIYKHQKKDHEKEVTEEETTATIKGKEKIEVTITTKTAEHSPILLPNTSVIASDTNTITSDVIRILNSQQINNYSDFCGYNNHNIQSITINFH